MKKKVMTVIFAVILLLSLGLFAWYRYNMNRVIGAQPLRIMIDGTRYVICGGVETRPDFPPDGTITEIIDAIDYPEKDGQANFGTVGMPYWKSGDKIVVESSQYYLFNEA